MIDESTGLVVQTNTAIALAEQARAVIEARFVVAMKRPRDIEVSRDRLLKECNRSGFASVAIYKKPVGGGKFVEGPSVRFAEAAIRCMGNVTTDTQVITEDEEKKVLRVTVSDIESNTSFSQEITVTKTVERSKPCDDGSYISVRKNTKGYNVYTVPGSDDDLINKTNSALSKCVRNLALRLLPGDIVDECILQCRDTQKKSVVDMKKLLSAFAAINVTQADIEAYLGKPYHEATVDDGIDLRMVGTSIREGETTWKEILEAKKPPKKINVPEEK